MRTRRLGRIHFPDLEPLGLSLIEDGLARLGSDEPVLDRHALIIAVFERPAVLTAVALIFI